MRDINTDMKFYGTAICVASIVILSEVLGATYATELIKLITAVIGLFALIWGIDAIRKELQLRSLDAACGYLARMATSLKKLKRAAYCPSSTGKLHDSVFISFCSYEVKQEIISGTGGRYFSGDKNADENSDENANWRIFQECANNTLSMFEEVGQFPLSEKILVNFDYIQTTLMDMLLCKMNKTQLKRHSIRDNSIKDPIDSPESVEDEMRDFDKLIDDTIEEVNSRRKRLLRKVWNVLDSGEE